MADIDPSAALAVEITADEGHDQALARASRAILGHPMFRQLFPASDPWLVGFDLDDKDDGDDPSFSTTVHDTISGRSARVEGYLDDPEGLVIMPTAHQWPPTDDEFLWAVSIVEEDTELGALLQAEGAYAYRPLPPLANAYLADGTVERIIAVGLRIGGPEPTHRIVGVRIADAEIVREPPGIAVPPSGEQGAPPAPATAASGNGASQARIRVRRGDTVVWELVVVRPRASSGVNGSGVELRAVDYKGQRVLSRAHLPILNVAYQDDADDAAEGTTHRLWLHEESPFGAEGCDPVEGFRLCSSPPQTILDTGADGGGFRGVACRLDGEELVVVSQLQAGWHRYLSEWRLHSDGTIRPRFGVGAVQNPCTSRAHLHHAYWRLDLDILDSDDNLVQEFNDPPLLGTGNWHTVRFEVRRDRSPGYRRYWRVRHVRASQGYSLVPGPDDGLADDYGAGDLWVLRYHPDEVDDGQGVSSDPARTRACLDELVSAESVERHDIVVWYGAHIAARGGSGSPPAARVGPDLVAHQWKEGPVERTPFARLDPPSQEELRPPASA